MILWWIVKFMKLLARDNIKKQSYKIWSILKRESVLSYWYVVMFDSTYSKLTDIDDIEELNKIFNELTDKAIDIRELENYKEIKGSEIIFHRKEKVVPIIKEAVKKGYIMPL